jgi:hypothetical protein
MKTTIRTIDHCFEFETPHGEVEVYATIEFDVTDEPAVRNYPQSELGCPALRTVSPRCIDVERVELFPAGTDDIVELPDDRQHRALLYWISEMLWKTVDPNELVDLFEWRTER